jgi:transposase-like protein
MSYNSILQVIKEFSTEEKCIKHLEKLRWPKGIICPCCGSNRKVYSIERSNNYKCADCKKQFSVRKGTIFEESRLPLQKWFVASWLVTSNRKGISSCQLAREIGVTQKTAWFMLGRLREVAKVIGGSGGPKSGEIETDETYLGGKEKNKHFDKKLNAGRGIVGKQAVVGLRERTGKVKIMKVSDTTKEVLQNFIKYNVAIGSTIYTDDHRSYEGIGEINYKHYSVNHSMKEYVRGQVHTNGIESFWALLKRGYYGTFHHFSWKHLNRYLAEFETRWNMSQLDDGQRLNSILESSSGCRLTYKALKA